MSYQPPRPSDTLAGCMWLPRILHKARASRNGTLPEEYAVSFGVPQAADGHFLAHFGLTLDEVLAAPDDDDDAATWFLGRVAPELIASWNAVAPNLGKPGYPMAERFAWARAAKYSHIEDTRAGSVFEVLDADEGR